MSTAEKNDLLIVGQGLAGSAVAVRALERGYKFIVLDKPANNRCSVVAAGLFNPFTGKNAVKTWLADHLFPDLTNYYPRVEAMTGEKFFHRVPIYRPFTEAGEQNLWMGKSADRVYSQYIKEVITSPAFHQKACDPFGGVMCDFSGYIDTRKYLNAIRRMISDRGWFRDEQFQPEKLKILEDGVEYGDIGAKRIIFCQGVDNASNPWFRGFTVRPLKGEYITVQCEWDDDVILNRGVYMVQDRVKGYWRVGATYNWSDASPESTYQARSELENKLRELIRLPFTFSSQQWGLRPTSPDRRPIIGAHPKHPALIIFNGLGTKGVSLAPYFSAVLIRWMENEGPMNEEADVGRFN